MTEPSIGMVENKVDMAGLKISKVKDDVILLRERIRNLVTQDNKSSGNIETLFERYAHLKDDFDRNKTYCRKNDNRVLKLIIQENKNSEQIRAALEDINQLYLLFNELLRSNKKKEKDDG